tara:strand:- start:161 stop:442 length:282 start_codon:yes stop_codon:yes gene_type:complete
MRTLAILDIHPLGAGNRGLFLRLQKPGGEVFDLPITQEQASSLLSESERFLPASQPSVAPEREAASAYEQVDEEALRLANLSPTAWDEDDDDL